ncbi:MAG: hypothetical protein EZS28_020252 [Streblomastix strix]|uniref:Reverse transcriptase domain-containing protein n=1 Tax=Streblomastix strix TaxID=222440 RepID=A0A5J4VNS5_9EUKA|nr:MAG: hypothetical protein EZS28_020252 [Streblomastix strix]
MKDDYQNIFKHGNKLERKISSWMTFQQIGLGLETVIQKELQEIFNVKVNGNKLKWLNPIFAILKKGKAGLMKLMDCKRHNSYLQYLHFKMEDIITLRELLHPGDQIIKQDLERAFNHITIEPNFRQFLRFKFKGRFYMFTTMCFGVHHYSIILHREVLAPQALQIVQITQDFQWKISQENQSFIAAQKCEFLRRSLNSLNNELMLASQR